MTKVSKGSNPWTEHYSGLVADVPDPTDQSTKMNWNIIKAVDDPGVGKIRAGGQALSHCVCNTLTDLINNFGSAAADKFELIRNTTDNVPGFEKLGDDFLNWFTGKGGKVVTI